MTRLSPQEILKKYWGFDAFRPMQLEIISAVLSGRDVLALLPTGGGKSICFQVPAMVMDGMCIVVSPLIALMKDQVAHLLDKGIPAVSLHTGISAEEMENILQGAVYGDYKFIYVSPERLQSTVFQRFLAEMDICMVAVDEAHCISQWGYDFRPPYLRIAALRPLVGKIPFLALTASATPMVQQDIVEKLQFRHPEIFKQSFARPNLSFQVQKVESKVNATMQWLKYAPGCAIIYCKSRKRTQDIADILQKERIAADFYHAGLEQESRNAKQESWMNNQIRLMVCTNAFGMGIDKPDVRLVIHFDVPDCLENYYQEAGRAGRDGQKAFAVLLYQDLDLVELQALPNLRFPEYRVIKQVYQSIGNYLQVPVGGGGELFYDFDIRAFCQAFQLSPILVLYALKELGKQGFVQFNESVFMPSKIRFLTDRATLENLEKVHPALSGMTKCLLRLYEGIFDFRVSVFEKQIAQYFHSDENKVKTQLHALEKYGLIEYLPQKNTPQIYFPTDRAPTEFLNFDHHLYRQQKDAFLQRVRKMLSYITEEKQCRSVFIAQYFGDETVAPCGICDNCMQRRKTKQDPKALKESIRSILNAIPQEGIAFAELKTKVNALSYFDQAIRLLENETLVYLKNGKIYKA